MTTRSRDARRGWRVAGIVLLALPAIAVSSGNAARTAPHNAPMPRPRAGAVDHAAHSTNAAPARPSRADTTMDTVWVVTNRQRRPDGFTRVASDSLWHGRYVARVIRDDSSAGALSALHVSRVDSVALSPDAWRSELRAAAAVDTSARRALLLFVHGYSTGPGTAVAQGEQVKRRGAHRGPLVLFLWPTHERYIAPPTPATAYRDDARAAAASAPALARVLLALDSVAHNAVLVAHSMGSRVALGALVSDSLTRATYARAPLRALGIFSPDVGAEQFRTAFAPELPALARRVAMYGAASDYLLGAAAIVNLERRASGLTRRGEPLAGIELIDDTRGARAEPIPLNLIGPRHSIRWASAAIADFFSIVVAGADPICRVRAGTADSTSFGRWRLRPDTLPPAWLGADCAPTP